MSGLTDLKNQMQPLLNQELAAKDDCLQTRNHTDKLPVLSCRFEDLLSFYVRL